MPKYEDYHRTVIGYHGTTADTARRIVSGDASFMSSENDYDWLGHGVYFWEYAPQQAFRWARHRYGKSQPIAVLASMIRLGNCLDLLDPDNVQPVLQAKHQLEHAVASQGKPLPRNFNANKYLDCAVFEYLHKMQASDDLRIDTIRAVYVPTDQRKRLWERSWLFHETHIQLCVRKPTAIQGTWLVRPTE